MNKQQTTINQLPITDNRSPATGIKSNKDFIPLSVPSIQGNEWKYVKECFDTNWVSSVGSYVNKFEDELADYVGAEHAVAMCNGTAALHIALLVCGVQPEDEVIVPALTFISPVNTVKYAGAHPVFMDADPENFQMDPQKLTDFLEKECIWHNSELRNSKTGRRISAIIPVDLLGHPVDMDPIVSICRKYDIKVIEDSTESLGAEYKGKRIGTSGDIACFSFNGNKIITTGGGGMLVTDNSEYADKARYLSQQAKDDPLEYYHKEVGYNYRLTNIQAAMGCAQLEQLENHIANKRAIALRYDEAFGPMDGIKIPVEQEWAKSTCWLYTILIDKDVYGIDSRGLLSLLDEHKIQTRPLWHPIHSLPPYSACQAYHIEVADKLYTEALSIPCSVNILPEDQEIVSSKIRSFGSSKK